MRKLVLIMMIIISVGCTKGAKSPEGLIQMMAKDLATKKLDMDYYEKFTTGAMLEQIKDLGEEQFEKNTRMVNVSDVKVSILSKTCESDKCVVTYSAKYKTKNSDEGKFESEVKKIAEVKKEEEFWKLVKVTNLKTYHESSEAINPLTEEPPKEAVEEVEDKKAD